MTLLQGIEKWVACGGSVRVACDPASHAGIFRMLFTSNGERPAETGFFWNRRNGDTIDDLETYWQELLASGNLEFIREMATMPAKS